MATLINSGDLSDSKLNANDVRDGFTFGATWTWATVKNDKGTKTYNPSNDWIRYQIYDSAGALIYTSDGYNQQSGVLNTTASKTWTYEGVLADGSYTLAFQVSTDGTSWGNEGSYKFGVDTTINEPELTNPAYSDSDPDAVWVNASGKLNIGTDTDVVTVEVILTDAAGAEIGDISTQSAEVVDGVWQYDLSRFQLLDGSSYFAEVVVTDGFGNSTSKTFSTIIDNTVPIAPSVTEFDFAPEGSTWYHDINVLGYVGVVAGTGEANATVNVSRMYSNNSLNDNNNSQIRIEPLTSFSVGADGKWNWLPTTNADGTGQINLSDLYVPVRFALQAQDAAGNVSKAVELQFGANAIQYGDDGVTILNNINDQLVGSSNDDLLIGYNGDDKLVGQAGNDWLYGGQGIDDLVGGAGDDHLIGGTQADRLDGGAGKDIFVYNRANESGTGGSADTIVNFEIGVDTLDFSNLLGSLGISTGAFNLSNKTSGSKAKASTSSLGEFWMDDKGVLYANVSGGSAADLSIKFVSSAIIDITAGDGSTYSGTSTVNDASLAASQVTALRSYLAGGGADLTR